MDSTSTLFDDVKTEMTEKDQWNLIKKEMLDFIGVAMSLAERVENLEKTVAYLAMKDPSFIEQLKEAGLYTEAPAE